MIFIKNTIRLFAQKIGATVICFLCLHIQQSHAQGNLYVKEYKVDSAQQAVAMDESFFYVINNASITKHLKSNGQQVKAWQAPDAAITHLNSGIIIQGKLYCCHSNYPDVPMASSIEIFDPLTLKPIGNHSFGIGYGSATWIDFYKGFWYVAFAHYTGKGDEADKDNSWSTLVKFNSHWEFVESWIYPKNLLKKFGTKSNSGGVILKDGTIICSGHDAEELYVLKIPTTGFTLQWQSSIPVGFQGQGFACEKNNATEYLLYGIRRAEKKVVVLKVKIED